MKKTLHYNFYNVHYQDGHESIPVYMSDYEFEVEDDSDLNEEELKNKYYNKALEEAAYKTMCEYADFGFKR